MSNHIKIIGINRSAFRISALCFVVLRVSCFAQSPANQPPFGWIDTQSLGTITSGGVLHFGGWAADQEDGVAKNVQLVMDGATILGSATLGFSRPDVAAFFNNTQYANTGWNFSCSAAGIAVGTHTVTAVAYDSAGSSSQLQGGATFTVAPLPPFGWLDTSSLGTIAPGQNVKVGGVGGG